MCVVVLCIAAGVCSGDWGCSTVGLDAMNREDCLAWLVEGVGCFQHWHALTVLPYIEHIKKGRTQVTGRVRGAGEGLMGWVAACSRHINQAYAC